MDTKEKFKNFVKANPNLIYYVDNNIETWQSLFEKHALYGDNPDVWNKYKKVHESKPLEVKQPGLIESLGLKNVFEALKDVDMEAVSANITSLQKGIDIMQDMIKKDVKPSVDKERPIYKRFED